MNDKNFAKMIVKVVINLLYPGTKFQLTWRTSDFGTKFAQKNMSEKKLKKLTLNSKQG